MKYIEEFIKKISAEDFNILIGQAFTKTEIDLILYYRNQAEDVSDENLATQLGIKPSTLKKIQSNLLFEAIRILSSDYIIDQTAYLSSVNCHRILIHVTSKKLSELKKEQNTEELIKLYTDIPYKLLGALITDYDIKKLNKFKKEFQILKPGLSYESVKLEILLYILEYMQYDSLSDEQIKWFETDFHKIDTLGNPELEFWKNKLVGDYYHLVDGDKYLELVKDNLELVNNNSFDFSESLILNSKLQYCFYLINHNKFQETYDFYNQLTLEYPKILGTSKGLRYTDLISQVCIVLGRYEEARSFILNAYTIEEDEPGKFAEIYFGNTTVLAMLDILEGNFEKAHKKISVAKIGLKKQYFTFLDALLRLVEQAYYFKIKDYEFADSLYQKNIKFYQYHKIDGLEVIFGGHKILSAYAKKDFNKKPLSAKCKEYQHELDQGDFAFIGHFIKNIG